MGNQLGLRDPNKFAPLWVVDFPFLEWDEENKRFHAMHHPFTSPKLEDFDLLETDPGKVRANAYDFVINGVEVGGGSIRIHQEEFNKKCLVYSDLLLNKHMLNLDIYLMLLNMDHHHMEELLLVLIAGFRCFMAPLQSEM